MQSHLKIYKTKTKNIRKVCYYFSISLQGLFEVAETVKATKESLRLKAMVSALEGIHSTLEATPTCLPLSPSLEVRGLQLRSCSYFPSNTLPLKLSFHCADDCVIPSIFKVIIKCIIYIFPSYSVLL